MSQILRLEPVEGLIYQVFIKQSDQIWQFFTIFAIFQSLVTFFHGKIAKDFGDFFGNIFYLEKFLIFNLTRLVKYELFCIYFLLFEGS
jgi:hypothetical protein